MRAAPQLVCGVRRVPATPACEAGSSGRSARPPPPAPSTPWRVGLPAEAARFRSASPGSGLATAGAAFSSGGGAALVLAPACPILSVETEAHVRGTRPRTRRRDSQNQAHILRLAASRPLRLPFPFTCPQTQRLLFLLQSQLSVPSSKRPKKPFFPTCWRYPAFVLLYLTNLIFLLFIHAL